MVRRNHNRARAAEAATIAEHLEDLRIVAAVEDKGPGLVNKYYEGPAES